MAASSVISDASQPTTSTGWEGSKPGSKCFVVKLGKTNSGWYRMAEEATATVDPTAPLAPAIIRRSDSELEGLVAVIVMKPHTNWSTLSENYPHVLYSFLMYPKPMGDVQLTCCP
jgi:hypothetical protein